MTLAALVLALFELAGGPGRGAKLDDIQRLAPVLLREAGRASPPFDPVLLGAIAFAESGYRPGARGSAQEIGVFQIHPKGMALYLCRGLVVSRLEDNARCGRILLEHARRTCGGSPSNWLGSFNGRRCGGSSYADRVLAIRRRVR